MRVANSILELIGRTPIVKLNNFTGPEEADIFVKLENFNPAGSVKDRPGLYMIEKAEKKGWLNRDSIILEATSGNTGIGLAMAASIKGYPIVIVMPENMSEERKKVLNLLGVQLVLTPAAKGMKGAVAEAERLAAHDKRYYLVKQFENPANAESHALSTGIEILEQMDNNLDAFVCGVGSGGTITGAGQVLKEALPNVLIVAVEPESSAVLSGQPTGSHLIQGIGAGFVPPVLDINIIDKIITVKDEEAIAAAQELARTEAILLGTSSGAAIHAAKIIAKELGAGKRILTIAPDGAEKYISTELFT